MMVSRQDNAVMICLLRLDFRSVSQHSSRLVYLIISVHLVAPHHGGHGAVWVPHHSVLGEAPQPHLPLVALRPLQYKHSDPCNINTLVMHAAPKKMSSGFWIRILSRHIYGLLLPIALQKNSVKYEQYDLEIRNRRWILLLAASFLLGYPIESLTLQTFSKVFKSFIITQVGSA